LKFGKTDKRVYSELTTDHPIDSPVSAHKLLYGPGGLINSGGASGENDIQQAVTAVINKVRRNGLDLSCKAKTDARRSTDSKRDPGRVSGQRGDYRLAVW
jgi:hypothetical protein